MWWGCGVGRGNKPAPRGRLHSHGRCRRLVRVHVGNIVVRRRSVLVVLVCRNLGDMLWHRIAGLLGLRLLGAVMFAFGGPVSFGATRNIKNKKDAFFFPRKLNPKKCVLLENATKHTATHSHDQPSTFLFLWLGRGDSFLHKEEKERLRWRHG